MPVRKSGVPPGSTSTRYKILGPLRRKVNNPRNSTCSAPLDRLDWDNWFTDYGFADDAGRMNGGYNFYLHVHHEDGESIHRVYCREAVRRNVRPRLELVNGELVWLIDRYETRQSRR